MLFVIIDFFANPVFVPHVLRGKRRRVDAQNFQRVDVRIELQHFFRECTITAATAQYELLALQMKLTRSTIASLSELLVPASWGPQLYSQPLA